MKMPSGNVSLASLVLPILIVGVAGRCLGEQTEGSKKVLRHAVFFSFKDASTDGDIQGVVDAFRALPNKIDAIVDFQCGVNNSPENLNDGFTHCFLLTFADEKGREIYLPHPAHKEFGNVLRPHMKDVFVIDFWGSKREPLQKELQHCVFFRYKQDVTADAKKKVAERFAALPEKIDAIKSFEWGENNSPEKHDDGFEHAFIVTFDSSEGLQKYLPHADHQDFVQQLLPSLDKPRVLDFWAEK